MSAFGMSARARVCFAQGSLSLNAWVDREGRDRTTVKILVRVAGLLCRVLSSVFFVVGRVQGSDPGWRCLIWQGGVLESSSIGGMVMCCLVQHGVATGEVTRRDLKMSRASGAAASPLLPSY